MTTDDKTHDEPDESNDDDEATLAASSDALDAIRAEAARVRSEQAAVFDPADDPTTVMIDVDPDLAEQPTIIRNFDPAEDPTIITFDVGDDPTTAGFDPADDPTTVISEPAPAAAEQKVAKKPAKKKVTAEAASANGSLIGDSLIGDTAPPATSASYWDRNELGAATSAKVSKGKGPVPKWFIATSLLAVLMACGLVLLVLWALSGST